MKGARNQEARDKYHAIESACKDAAWQARIQYDGWRSLLALPILVIRAYLRTVYRLMKDDASRSTR